MDFVCSLEGAEEVWQCHIPFGALLTVEFTALPLSPVSLHSLTHGGMALPSLCLPAGSIWSCDAGFNVQLCPGIHNHQPLEMLCSFYFYFSWWETKQGHERISLINVTASSSSEI